jgi:membrane-bound lytic murein transglycosylase MltF
MKILKSIVYLITILFCSCSSSNKPFVISVDPAFYSIEAMGKEKNILAFLTDLTSEVSRRSGMMLQLQSTNWDTLLSGLEKKEYQGVICGLPRYNFTESLYTLSDIFLESGPVLVTRKDSKRSSLKKLSGQEVGVMSGSKAVELLSTYPSIIMRSYDTTAKMLIDVQNQTIQGAIVGIIPAIGYTGDLYQNTLMIASEPLLHEGLRLITLKDENRKLEHLFSKTLRQMEKEGYLHHLKCKWGLCIP